MFTATPSLTTSLFRRSASARSGSPGAHTNPLPARADASDARKEALLLEFLGAAGRGDLRTLGACLDRDPSLVSAGHTVGGTALHFAVAADQYEAADLLLRRGANPNGFGETVGETPLHL